MNVLQRLAIGSESDRFAYRLLSSTKKDISVDMMILNDEGRITAPVIHGNPNFFRPVLNAVTAIDKIISTHGIYPDTALCTVKVFLKDGAVIKLSIIDSSFTPMPDLLPREYPFIVRLSLQTVEGPITVEINTTVKEDYHKKCLHNDSGLCDRVCSALYTENAPYMANLLKKNATSCFYSYCFMDGKTGEIIFSRDENGKVYKNTDWTWLDD